MTYIEKYLLQKINWNNQFVLLGIVGTMIFTIRDLSLSYRDISYEIFKLDSSC